MRVPNSHIASGNILHFVLDKSKQAALAITATSEKIAEIYKITNLRTYLPKCDLF